MSVKYNLSDILRILTAVFSIAASAVVAISAAGKLKEKATIHHANAVAYGKLFREAEEILVLGQQSAAELQMLMKLLREKAVAIPDRTESPCGFFDIGCTIAFYEN